MKKITLLLLFTSTISFAQTKQLDSYKGYYYNEVSNTLEESYKAEFTYNTSHKNTDESDFDVDDNGNWQLQYQVHYTYDENDNIIVIEDDESFKFTLSYNANNNLIEKIGYNWNTSTSQWENSSKYVHNYENDRIIEKILYYWDINNSQWEISNKKTFQYNANDLLEIYENYYYDSNTSLWVLNYSNSYTYDSNNLLIEVLSSDNDKTQLIYDANSFITDEISFGWDSNTNSWTEESKISAQYDSNANYSQLALPYTFFEGLFNYQTSLFFQQANNVLTVYEYDNGSWIVEEKIFFFYSNTTASTNDISNDILSIYPNPFTNELSINFPSQENIDLILFDIQGRRVFNKTFISNQKVTISSLESGIYFYEVTTMDNKFKGKLIKK